MAFLANYPIAVAPAMGHNFFFAFTVVAGMGYSWQVALGAVFISGIAFLMMSIWGVREALVHAIPDSLKRGIAVGIGLLITLVGLEWSGLVSANPGHWCRWATSTSPRSGCPAPAYCHRALLVRRSRGAILAGILTSTVLGLVLGVVRFHGIVSAPPSIAPIALKLDIAGGAEARRRARNLHFLFSRSLRQHRLADRYRRAGRIHAKRGTAARPRGLAGRRDRHVGMPA